jgi:cell division protein FtsB
MNRPAAQARSRVPRIAGAAVERARLTVVPRTRAVRAARVPFVLFVSLILLMGVVGLLMFNTSMQQATFALDTYQERAVSLAAREEQLTAELETLRDPQTLAEKAQRLGMVLPPCSPTLVLGSGSVEGADACDGAPGKPLDLDPPAAVSTYPYGEVQYVEVERERPADGAASDADPGDGGKNKNKNKSRNEPGNQGR